MCKKDGRLEEVRYNKNGEEMKIIRYGNAKDIDVQFVKDGVIVERRQYDEFKTGRIKNPMTPSVYGVGFIGKGRFKAYDGNGKPTKCHKVWKSMHTRCYDPKYHEKNQVIKIVQFVKNGITTKIMQFGILKITTKLKMK